MIEIKTWKFSQNKTLNQKLEFFDRSLVTIFYSLLSIGFLLTGLIMSVIILTHKDIWLANQIWNVFFIMSIFIWLFFVVPQIVKIKLKPTVEKGGK